MSAIDRVTARALSHTPGKVLGTLFGLPFLIVGFLLYLVTLPLVFAWEASREGWLTAREQVARWRIAAKERERDS